VDCCTLQESLFESELFGHERGAFTGADRRKPGLMEAAAKGTLFLDEIGEIGPAIQSKLLRVLETGRFRRVGATVDVRGDARIVAATNRNLAAQVGSGLFREDLFYRLTPFVIEVPPLRERGADILLLARNFIAHRRHAQGLPTLDISPAAVEHLSAYAWPGNVRELRNVVERAMILAGQGDCVELAHLTALSHGSPDNKGLRMPPVPPATAGASVTVKGVNPGVTHPPLVFQGEPTLESIEREYLLILLKRYKGNRSKVARVLGVAERTAYRMLDRHRLDH
jgi:transcriptional regulator with PAS, ATPase and Fis domain